MNRTEEIDRSRREAKNAVDAAVDVLSGVGRREKSRGRGGG